jgi:hypothetical protein
VSTASRLERRVADARRARELAEADVAAFVMGNVGTWWPSKAHDEHALTERLMTARTAEIRARHSLERATEQPSQPAAARAPGRAPAGPPPDLDRPRDHVVQAVIDHEDAWPPTQPAISEALGWAADGRRIRQVQGPRGWRGILDDAQRRRRLTR